MTDKLSEVVCPVCNHPIPLDNKHWVIKCAGCGKEIQIVEHDGRIISVRQFMSLNYSQNNLEIFLGYIKNNLSLEKWGFKQTAQTQSGYIFDSVSCRVKFEFGQVNYYPQQETFISYGRLHAPNNEKHMKWNGKNCLCWHENMYITIPFIESIPPQKLADDRNREIWDSLINNLNVDYPIAGHLEYPLRLHQKIWENYGEKLFSIFDLQNPEIWEEYSKYVATYNETVNKRLNLSRIHEMIC